jgi:hypothetical protein
MDLAGRAANAEQGRTVDHRLRAAASWPQMLWSLALDIVICRGL